MSENMNTRSAKRLNEKKEKKLTTLKTVGAPGPAIVVAHNL